MPKRIIEEEDDELLDEPSVKTVSKKKAVEVDEDDEEDVPSKAPANNKQSVKASDDEDEEVAPSEEEFDTVEFGDEEMMKADYLQRLVVKDKGVFARFTILPDVKPIRRWSHYVEGKGSFQCFSDHNDKKAPKAACCKTLGEAGVTVAALVLHYTNADSKTGKLAKDRDVEFDIKYLKLSKTQFKDISSLAEEDGTVFGIDITMSVKSNGIGFDYKRISSKAKYLTNGELTAAVKDEVVQYKDGKKLSKTLPKKITKAELNTYLSAARGEEEDPDMDDIEDI